MSKLIDLIGQKFGRLTVVKRVENSKAGNTQWLCLCDCGNYTVSTSSNLKGKHTKSCGCLNRELTSKRNKKYNTYNLSGSYGVGYASNGQEFYFDLEDYDKIKEYCWYIDSCTGYVRTRISKSQQISMHKLLFPDSKEVDHKKENSRNDNRKSNLRVGIHQNNMMNKKLQKNNTSGVTGVYWMKNRNKWRSEITYKNKVIQLGYFKNFDDAVKVRKEAEEKYFGEWSYDNSNNSENDVVTNQDICNNKNDDIDLSWLDNI